MEPRPHHRHVLLAMLALTAATPRALACPSCAANGADTTRTLVSIGVFLLLPFVLAGLVVAFARTLPRPHEPTSPRATKR